MIAETTNQQFSDTNNSVPRVIKRGKITAINTGSVTGGKFRLTASETVDDILAITNPIVDCFYYSSSALIRMNNLIMAAYGTVGQVINYYMDSTTVNGNDVLRINVDIVSNISTPIDVYYVVYSASFGEGSII